MAKYFYHINLDERGEFFADVRNSRGKTFFEIHGFEIFEDGFMRHKDDIFGLEDHLLNIRVMKDRDTLQLG